MIAPHWQRTRTSGGECAVILLIQDTTELIDELVYKGYERGRDLAYLQVEGGQHHPSTWASVLDQFLLFAFGNGMKNKE